MGYILRGMATVGNHVKFQVAEEHRDRVRTFYTEILGATAGKAPVSNVDIFVLPDGFVHGIFFVPVEQTLNEQQCLNGTWLEIMTADPEGLKQRLREFGVKEIEYWDKNHFYFHAPGGPVFRIAPETERVPRA